MKVALIIEWMDPWRGGAETSTSQFVRHLIERDVEITLVTRSRLSPAPGMDVCTVPVRTPFRARRTLIFARRAAEIARGGDFDLVHAITPCLAADVYEPRGGTMAETIRRNLAIHRPGPKRELKRAANRLNLKQRRLLQWERRWMTGADRPEVVAISDYVVRQFREHYNYPPEKLHKVFNGVDPDTSDEATRQRNRAAVRRLYHVREDELLVIMVAHNFRLKGVPRWLEALKRLADTTALPIKSLIIGKDNSARWERLANRAGLEKRVQFTGPTRRIASFFHAADILVHPTYYDPCSRVVLEALASGLPPVTTHYDGAAEVIRHGQNGFVLEEDDCVGGLVEAVKQLADRAAREKMGQEARRAAETVSMGRHADAVYQLYQALLTP